MARLLYGNFDFEHELATPHYNRPKRLARLNAELAPCLIPLAQPDDQVWFPERPPEDYADDLVRAGLLSVERRSPEKICQVRPESPVVLEPWGWSAAAVEFARQIGVDVPLIDFNAVRTANSRGFSFTLEQSLGVALPGSIRLESSRQLVGAVAESAAAWTSPAEAHRVILKAAFGMSGRERIALRGDEVLTPSVHGWINRRVEQSGAVYLEPWLDRVAEFSTHWDIGPSSTSAERVQFVGRTQLLNTPHGQYVGSRVGAVADPLASDEIDPLLSTIESTAKQAAHAVAELGYTGPLGIDAMIYRDPAGQLCARPIQDINARWSMGRVALALRRRLSPTGCLSLLRIPSSNNETDVDEPTVLADGTSWFRLTPRLPGHDQCSEAMIVVLAKSAVSLVDAEQQTLDQRTS